MSDRVKLIIAFAAVYFVWGSTFFFVKLGLQSFSPFILSAFRFATGGTALLIFSLIKREKFPEINTYPKHFLVGSLVLLGGVVTVAWAQQFISSSMASAIITTPFWFVILDRKQWAYYFSNPWILMGLFLGLSGVVLLMTQKQSGVSTASITVQIFSILTVVLGSFLWVSGSLYLKYNPSKSSIYADTTIQLFSACIASLIIAFFDGEITNFEYQKVSTTSWLSVVYLAIASNTLTFLAFMWLIKVQPPVVVSTYAYVNPLVATLLGWLFGNEHISSIQLMALGIILSGVLCVNLGKNLKLKIS